MTDQLLLSVADAAVALSVSKSTMWRLFREGYMTRVVLPTGGVRVHPDEIARCVKEWSEK